MGGVTLREQTESSDAPFNGVRPMVCARWCATDGCRQVVCLGGRFALIIGGHPQKGGCFSSAIHVLDLLTPPAAGAALRTARCAHHAKKRP